MKKFLINTKLYEIITMLIFIVAIIIVGVLFGSPFIVVLNSLICVISVFLITKGNYWGNVLQIVFSLIYSYIAFTNKYYGEVLFYILINLPIYICSTIFWLKNRNTETNEIKINNIKFVEYILLFCVGSIMYVALLFLLKYLNTANLYVSTLSLIIGSIDRYPAMRRCEYSFVVYIILNLIGIALWFNVVAADMSNIPTIMLYVINLYMNISGIFNWKRLKNLQNQSN